ncbi:MAG TPA: alpha/beta hydrolase [Puia sp.]|jgi:acetyl esterase/lipase|nr:alpha/beta hydrolase [Puia sp.]
MKSIKEVLIKDSPSHEIGIVSDWWRQSAINAQQQPSVREAREANELWQILTAEPREVDYTEVTAGGVRAMWAIPKSCKQDRVILCFHGGGFFVGSMYTHRKMYAHLAKAAGCRALILDYSLVPENVHPTQVKEGVNAYTWLLRQGIQATHIAFAGDSAGGGLAVGTMQALKDQALPLPSAAVAMSPWFDMAGTGQSMIDNAGKDLIFNISWVRSMGQMYVGQNGDPKDPLASPLYGNLAGLPPIYIHVGGDELLLDDSRNLAEAANKAGSNVSVGIFPHMQHTFQMAAGRAPEADHSLSLLADWLKPHLGL